MPNRRLQLPRALRGLARSPWSLLLIVASLALGIGSNTALFSLARAILTPPLEAAHPSRLAALGATRTDPCRLLNEA